MNLFLKPTAENGPPAEKRMEPRRTAHGSVEVQWRDAKTVSVTGKLMDVSESGFRMAHDCKALEAGQVVEFSHAEKRGKARAVWTRIVAGSGHSVETGFFVSGK